MDASADVATATGWLGVVRGVFQLLREFSSVAIVVASVSLVFVLVLGTPEVRTGDRVWLRGRRGLLDAVSNWLDAYVERTNVFRGMQEELREVRAETKRAAERTQALEETVDWQSRVLLVMAQVLGVDMAALLPARGRTATGPNIAGEGLQDVTPSVRRHRAEQRSQPVLDGG